MEYGTYTNPAGHVSPEPGAFGAAWVASTWPVALAHGVSEIYHWTMLDEITDTDGVEWPMLYGWAWLFALGELLVGGDARALATSADYGGWESNATSVLGVGVVKADAGGAGGAG